jgi:hypothetical protein
MMNYAGEMIFEAAGAQEIFTSVESQPSTSCQCRFPLSLLFFESPVTEASCKIQNRVAIHCDAAVYRLLNSVGTWAQTCSSSSQITAQFGLAAGGALQSVQPVVCHVLSPTVA